MQAIIFTDLDGTLLNHDDYSYHEANAALKKILHHQIPLIFTTSKTKSEVEVLQQTMNIQEPFIVENGAAIFFPTTYKQLDFSILKPFESYYILQLGKSYKEILEFYNQYKNRFELKGFSDMSLEEIMQLTQLSPTQAKLCQQRDFTEPFIIKNTNKLNELKPIAKKHGLKITKGGRFYHLMGEHQDKGEAVKKTCDLFQQMTNQPFQTIALGDGENDIEMLQNVDIPIVIQNHKGKYISFESKHTIEYSTYQSSKGWNEMILKHI